MRHCVRPTDVVDTCRAQLTVTNHLMSHLRRLTAELLNYNGIPLAQAVAAVRQSLPRSATLVGQNIGRDVEWLQLKEGVDFKACPLASCSLLRATFAALQLHYPDIDPNRCSVQPGLLRRV